MAKYLQGFGKTNFGNKSVVCMEIFLVCADFLNSQCDAAMDTDSPQASLVIHNIPSEFM